MPTTANTLDLSVLPAAKRREIKDFYQFLLSRRTKRSKSSEANTLPVAFESPIQVKEYLKISRDEIYEEI
jgi:hypothetical protein